VSGIDQTHLEAAAFKDLEKRDPVDAGRFHGDGTDVAGFQPIGQGDEIFCKGSEMTDRLITAIDWDSDVEFSGADIDAGRIGI
jgi:hypothetical protein